MTWPQTNPPEVGPVPVPEGELRSDAGADAPFISKLSLLWSERRFLFWMTVWGAICSVALVMAIPVRFEATARLMPPDSSDAATMMAAAVADRAGPLGGMALGALGMKSSGDLMAGILSSTTVQDRLIERFKLKQVYGLSYQEDVRERLSNNTGISVDRKSGIITITVTDRDKQRAADIANAYVEELSTLSVDLSTSAARREREFLEVRLGQVAKDLEQAEKDLSQFSSKNATINPQEQGRAMVTAAASLEARLIELQAQLEGVRSIYTDDSAPVRTLKAQIASLQQEIRKMGGKAGMEAAIQDSSQLYPSIRQLPLLGVTWTDLYRRARIEEAVYEILTKQYELAKVQEKKEVPNLKVLDRGQVPQKKSFPPRTVITVLGTMFAFAFAVVWTLGRARWEATSPDSPGRRLVEQVLATFRFKKRRNEHP